MQIYVEFHFEYDEADPDPDPMVILDKWQQFIFAQTECTGSNIQGQVMVKAPYRSAVVRIFDRIRGREPEQYPPL